MAITPLALVLALAQRPNDQYTLGALGDTFVVRKGATRESIPRALPPTPQKAALAFRRDARWAVWDERGLTTRDGKWTATDRFKAVPTSPRIGDKEAILDTLAKIKSGKRSLAASGLSGARRIEGTVYLLPRWDDADGKPWLEALMAVDLSKKRPKARLLGTFEGLSLGRGPFDERMGIEKGRLSVAVNTGAAWGIASYDPARKEFDFNPRGDRLIALEKDGRVIEETSYGTTLAGRLEGSRTLPWMELRGPAEFVPGDGPVLVRAGNRLRNAATGAELRLNRGAAVRRSKAGVLVFWPEDKPRSARLVDFERLEELARWETGTK